MKNSKKTLLAFIAIAALLPALFLGYEKFSIWQYERSDYGLFSKTINSISNCGSSCGWTKLDNHTLLFTGEIKYEDRDQQIKKLKILIDANIKSISLNSQGGDIETAMKMAEIILEHDLDTIVSGVCLSACANYLFPAGKNKEIEGVLGFHGGIASILEQQIDMTSDKSSAPLSNASFKKLLETERHERELNAKTGLKRELLLMSGRPDKGEGDGYARGLFFPTPNELAYYGLENIKGDQNEEIMCGYEKRSRLLFYTAQYRFVYHEKIDCSKYKWF